MTILSKGSYTIPNGSLVIVVLKIQYQNANYIKFKAHITSKTSGYIYETKNYKLLHSAISHWEKIFI